MNAENILIGFREGVVTSGEVTEALLWPPNGTLIRTFLSMVRKGEISHPNVQRLIHFLREKAHQHFELARQLEGILQTPVGAA